MTVTVTIDGRQFQVEEGHNMLEVSLSLGFDLPYFCWHPALGSVGACRQCAVKQYWTGRDGREHEEIVMACMTAAEDGTRIDIHDAEAIHFRRSMIELLMTNHPHDCPICDEGGECHLQDMTVMTGHDYRRYRYTKRTFENQDLGPFVTHELNRCIACYRCVRFYNDYAGGHDFGVFANAAHVYFGRAESGTLESEFSGNLIEVCPTGVFDDKTLAPHYTRKWDLQTAPAVCPHCGMGCNVIPGERYGELRRVLARYNEQVNGFFICDRGRFGYEFVNAPERVVLAATREGAAFAAAPAPQPAAPSVEAQLQSALPAEARLQRRWPPAAEWPAAAQRAGGLLPGGPDVRPASLPSQLQGFTPRLTGEFLPELARRLRGARVIGVGSPRASLESNFALRSLVGADRFFTGMSTRQQRLCTVAAGLLRETRPLTLPDLMQADAALVLGEDLTAAAAMLALNVRTWLRLRPTTEEIRLHITRWNDAGLGRVKRYEPSVLWQAATHAGKLDELARETYLAAPDDLARFALAVAHEVDAVVPPVEGLDDAQAERAQRVAAALTAAERPVVIAGTSAGSEALMRAAAALARSLQRQAAAAPLYLVTPEPNSLGLALMGGRELDEAFAALAGGEADAVIVLENDLYRRAPTAAVDAFLEQSPLTVTLDALATATAAGAHAVLPAATWAESSGTYIGSQGSAQRSFKVMEAHGDARESWRWLRDLMRELERPEGAWRSLDDVIAALVAELPALAVVREAAPPATARVGGQPVARMPARFSGRTAMYAHLTEHEPAPAADQDGPFSFSMEGSQEDPPAALVPRFWAPAWNSVNSLHRFQEEIDGPLRGGPAGASVFGPGGGASDGVPGTGGGAAASSNAAPAAPVPFAPRPGEWLLVPRQHLFGSGELSMFTPGIAEQAPAPYVALNGAGAAALGVQPGELVDVPFDGQTARLPLLVDESLPAGVAGLPAGLPGLPFADLPCWSALARAEVQQ
jgi:NADH-quinone oxidoreductase subunit G